MEETKQMKAAAGMEHQEGSQGSTLGWRHGKKADEHMLDVTLASKGEIVCMLKERESIMIGEALRHH